MTDTICLLHLVESRAGTQMDLRREINKAIRKNDRKKIKSIGKKICKRWKPMFTEEDYNSKDGMQTSTWGPALWMYLHLSSLNYDPSRQWMNEC